MHFGRICAAVHCCRSLGDQQNLKLDVAVPQALLPVNLGAVTSQTDMAVLQACCQTVVCTAALCSEGCSLAGVVLQCTLACRCAFV